MKSLYKIEKVLPIKDSIPVLSFKEKTIKRLMYSYEYQIEVNEDQKNIRLIFNFYSLFKTSILGGIFLCLLPVIGLVLSETEILERLIQVLLIFIFSSSFLFLASRHYEINHTIGNMKDIIGKSITRHKSTPAAGRS